MLRVYELLVIFMWAIGFAAAGVWSRFSSGPFPFPGFRRVAEAEGSYPVLQVVAVLVAAAWLAVHAWQTRERLLVFQGMAIVLSFEGFLYIGVPFGLAFSCFAGIARSRGIHRLT
jgi:hypothetical protein